MCRNKRRYWCWLMPSNSPSKRAKNHGRNASEAHPVVCKHRGYVRTNLWIHKNWNLQEVENWNRTVLWPQPLADDVFTYLSRKGSPKRPLPAAWSWRWWLWWCAEWVMLNEVVACMAWIPKMQWIKFGFTISKIACMAWIPKKQMIVKPRISLLFCFGGHWSIRQCPDVAMWALFKIPFFFR